MLTRYLTSAWIGWFPVIFYTTTYIGELYKANSPLMESPNPDPDALAALSDEGTRLGTRAMLCSSILTLASTILLPFFIANSSGNTTGRPRTGHRRPWWKLHLASLWAASHLVFSLCMGATPYVYFDYLSTVLILIR